MNYDEFMQLLKHRRSIRRFKPDPVPDDYIMKILDAAHFSMSGANSQPWEFIVVRDPEIKKQMHQAWVELFDLIYAVEQQRIPEYRHPAFNVPPEDKEKAKEMVGGWKDAPVLIAVLEDGRKMYGSVLIGRSDFRHASNNVGAATMGHLGMTIHLAAASLGLASQRVDVPIHEPFRKILKYPLPLCLDIIVPIGYAAYDAGMPHRFALKDMVHFNQYDMSKFLRNEDFLSHLGKIRALARSGYRVAIGEGKA